MELISKCLVDSISTYFSCCSLSFEVVAPHTIANVLPDLVGDFKTTTAPEYSIQIDLDSSLLPRDIDWNRRYSAEYCQNLIKVSLDGSSRFVARIAAVHRDLISAVLGYAICYGLARNNGFLLHASAGLCRNLTFIFSGPSGAGKSTLIRQAKSLEAIHDDMVAIRWYRDAWWAFGVPLCDNRKKPGRNLAAPVHSLYLITKGKESFLGPASQSELVERLFEQVFLLPELPFARQQLESCFDLVATTSLHELVFSRHADVSSLILRSTA